MRSANPKTSRVPKVSDDQLALDQTVKYLRKLRWIGKELEAEEIPQLLDDASLQPSDNYDWTEIELPDFY